MLASSPAHMKVCCVMLLCFNTPAFKHVPRGVERFLLYLHSITQACQRPDELCVLTRVYSVEQALYSTLCSTAQATKLQKACKRPDEPCVLVAAPSNVAVDQMADKISQTGLKVRSAYFLANRVTQTDKILQTGLKVRSASILGQASRASRSVFASASPCLMICKVAVDFKFLRLLSPSDAAV
eukprot:scaffold28309_cov21-Tisochrysis_lutea.AAC.1